MEEWQLGAALHAERLLQALPHHAERGKCVRLPTRPVQRQYRPKYTDLHDVIPLGDSVDSVHLTAFGGRCPQGLRSIIRGLPHETDPAYSPLREAID
jgi:hypothetical protein